MQVPAGNANAITGEAAVVPSLGSKLGKALKSGIPFAQIFAEESSAPEVLSEHKAEGLEENVGKPAEFASMLSQEKPLVPQIANTQPAGRGIGQAAAHQGAATPPLTLQMRARLEAWNDGANAEVEHGAEVKSSSSGHDGSKHSPAHRQNTGGTPQVASSSSQHVLDGKSTPSIVPFPVSAPIPVSEKVESVPSGVGRGPVLPALSSQPSTNKTTQGPIEMSQSEAHVGGATAQDVVQHAVTEMHTKSPDGKSELQEASGKEQHLPSPSVSASTNQASPAPAQMDAAVPRATNASFEKMTQPEVQPVSPVSENDVRAAMLPQQAAASGKQKSPGKSEAENSRSIKPSALEPGMSPSVQMGAAVGSGAMPSGAERHLSSENSATSGNNTTSGTDNNLFQHLDAGDAQATLMHSSAREVVVGVRDPSLGWVEIQTQSSGGHVSASLAAVSPEAHASLAAQAPAIAQYLEDRNVHVHTLDVGMQEGAQHGNGGQQSSSSGNQERETFQSQDATRGRVQTHMSSTESGEENVPEMASARISVRA